MRCGRHERRAKARLAGLALVVLALLGGGCGNAKRDFRVEKLNPEIQRVEEQRAELASLLRISHPKRARDARVLRAQLARLRVAMRRLAALSPPEGTGTQFRRYTRANAALLASLSRFVDAFAGGSETGQVRAQQDVENAVARAGRAQTQLQHTLK